MKALRIGLPATLAVAMAALLLAGRYRFDYDMLVLGFPLALGGFAIAMAGIIVVAEWRAPAEAPADAKKGMFDEAEELLDKPQAWLQFAWLIAGIAFCLGLGFGIGPALLVAAYLRTYGRSWKLVLIGGVASGAAIWLVFGVALKTTLPMMPLFLR